MTDVFIMAGLFNVSPNWFLNGLRTFFAFFDFLIYGFIEIFFRAIFNLSNFELIGLYEVFEKRIYVILGIFMLFKVTVSLITYLVNPDKISDKEQGMAKVVTRIITVLVMLIALPTFFNLMTEFQNKLLPVVPRVIMGTANTLKSEDVGGIASSMSLSLLNGFAPYKSDECSGNSDLKVLSTVTDFLDHVNDTCENKDNGKKIYAYDYVPIFSTIVGAIMIYVLFSLCITVAIRAFKLIILRMLAPIPIVSYIDPKSSKDGMFSHWTKTFMSTWAELFILQGIIYFIVYMIRYLFEGNRWMQIFDNFQSSGVMVPIDGILFLAFLIIGLLMFARQAPKFIFDALGIKNNGSFARMLGMGAAALGGVGAARAAYRARNEYDTDNNRGSHRLRNFGASLFSGLGAGMAGGNALLSSDKPTLTTGFDAMAKNNATALSRINAGSTLGGRLGAMGQALWAGETTADINERKIKNLKAGKSALEAVKSRVSSEMVKKNWTFGDLGEFTEVTGYDSAGNAITVSTKGISANYKSFMAAKNAAAAEGKSDFEFFDSKGNSHRITMQSANMQEGFLLKNNESNYIEQHVNGTVAGNEIDKVLMSNISNAEQYNPSIHITNRSSVTDNIDSIGLQIQDAERENARHVANRRGQGNKGN